MLPESGQVDLAERDENENERGNENERENENENGKGRQPVLMHMRIITSAVLTSA